MFRDKFTNWQQRANCKILLSWFKLGSVLATSEIGAITRSMLSGLQGLFCYNIPSLYLAVLFQIYLRRGERSDTRVRDRILQHLRSTSMAESAEGDEARIQESGKYERSDYFVTTSSVDVAQHYSFRKVLFEISIPSKPSLVNLLMS